MALREVAIPVPFAAGLDTKSDPKQAPVGRLLTCENAVFTKGTSLVKRNGYSALSQAITAIGTDYTDTRALASRGTETVLLTDDTAYSYAASTSTWSEIGPVAS